MLQKLQHAINLVFIGAVKVVYSPANFNNNKNKSFSDSGYFKTYEWSENSTSKFVTEYNIFIAYDSRAVEK